MSLSAAISDLFDQGAIAMLQFAQSTWVGSGGSRMDKSIRAVVFAAGALAYLSLGIWVRAQSVTATLVGTVFDSSNAAVPLAKISLTNKGTNVTRKVVGNERG